MLEKEMFQMLQHMRCHAGSMMQVGFCTWEWVIDQHHGHQALGERKLGDA